MSLKDRVKNWATKVGLVPQREEATPLPDSVVQVVKAARETKTHAVEDLDQLSALIAEGSPLTGNAIKQIVESVWQGEIVPEDFDLFGSTEGVTWFYEKALEAEREIVKEAKPKRTGFKVFQDTNGSDRWFGWVSNNWQDRENEIITSAAHREYVSWLDRHPDQAPELWSWHTKGTARQHRADWWEYSDGFLMMSGPLTKEEAEAYRALGDDVNIGMSHGFRVYNQVGPYILQYRSFEVSDLPVEYAANPFTNFEVSKMAFSNSKRAYLAQLLGEDRVAELESTTEDMEKALTALGLSRKELDEDYENYLIEQAKTKAQEDVDSLMDSLVDRLNIEQLKEILETFSGQLESLKGLQTEVETLRQEVEALKETEDERVSSLFTPRAPINWSVTKSSENEVEEADLTQDVATQVKEAKNEFSWLRGMTPGNGLL